MNKSKKLSLIAIIFMTIFSFAGFLKLFNENIVSLSSITLLIGIVVYFITREPEEKDAMSLKTIPALLKNWKITLLVLVPIVADIVCYVLAKLYVHEFLEHLTERTAFLSFDKIVLMAIELIVAALGEEIAWRGFFLNRLSKKISFVPSLLITSCLFALCHLSAGSVVVVVYDLTFIVINAILYGLVYKRTNNIIVSTLSHFLSNLFSVLIILLPFINQ
ncbi:MAG: CPBP family intramembrane metalloprotease [Lachnospiraceae bacterium]|nr:CPBP family intramembrane metalloprotease [Lachnospiraceae bacterium]